MAGNNTVCYTHRR